MGQGQTSESLCPHCNGKCCRDTDFGYRVVHMGAEFYMHVCEYCTDGDKYVPSPDLVQRERNAIVSFLRERANAPHPMELGIPSLSPAGRGLLLLMADRIEQGQHHKGEE